MSDLFSRRWRHLNDTRDGKETVVAFERRAMLAAEQYGFLAEWTEAAEMGLQRADELRFGKDVKALFGDFLEKIEPIRQAASNSADLAEAEFKQHPDYNGIYKGLA